MTPTVKVKSDNNGAECFRIPDGFRPRNNHFSVHQGSYANRWFLRITTEGVAYACRYATETYVDIDPGAYMPFCAVWATSDAFPTS